MQTNMLNQIRNKYGKNSNEYKLAVSVFEQNYDRKNRINRVLSQILNSGAEGVY